MKTFESGKNANELQIDVDRKFIVVNGDNYFNKGDMVTLLADDNSEYPYFIRESDGRQYCFYWCDLYYYEEELKTGDEVLVKDEDDTSELEKIFLFKKGNDYYCGCKEYINNKYLSAVKWKYVRKKPTKEDKEMSVDEIEKELGYNIKIVNDKQ